MLIQTKALVIKENNVGEQDRLVTLLTEKAGVIRAFARGARSVKSKSLSATRLFCYSSMTIWASADKYVIREAEPIEVFFELRDDIEKIALAQFFSQACMELAPQEERAEDYLKLTLNCLHFLAKGTRSQEQIKSIFELRILSLSGYMPSLEGCAKCGVQDANQMYFNTTLGEIYCSSCSTAGERISASVLSAMRYIVYSDFKKVFSFNLSDEALTELSRVSERFFLEQTARDYTTLSFYNTVHRGLK